MDVKDLTRLFLVEWPRTSRIFLPFDVKYTLHYVLGRFFERRTSKLFQGVYNGLFRAATYASFYPLYYNQGERAKIYGLYPTRFLKEIDCQSFYSLSLF